MADERGPTAATRSHARRDQWSEWLLTVAALAFLVAYAWPILDPTLGSGWVNVCRAVAWGAWGLFAVEYLARLWASDDRPAFVRGHLLDLLVIALPLLRPLRLLRLVTLLSVLGRSAGGSLRGRVVVFVVGATLLVLFIAGLAVLDAERGAEGANITTFPDALWWALTTITTVGYGDQFPVTDTGRLVAVGLMVSGIALLGIVTATFASWLIERVTEVDEAGQAATRADIAALSAQVSELRALIESDNAWPDRR